MGNGNERAEIANGEWEWGIGNEWAEIGNVEWGMGMTENLMLAGYDRARSIKLEWAGIFRIRIPHSTLPISSHSPFRICETFSMTPSSAPRRVALVTGSSTGLGKAIAFELGRRGMKVALNYNNNEQRAQTTYAQFRDLGYEGIMLRANVIDPQEVGRMYAQIREQLGPVDVLGSQCHA